MKQDLWEAALGSSLDGLHLRGFCEQFPFSGGQRPVEQVSVGDGESVLRLELPGVPKEDIKVSVDGVILTIKVSPTDATLASRFAVSRRYRLGATVDAESVSATHKDGLLSVHVREGGARTSRTVEIL